MIPGYVTYRSAVVGAHDRGGAVVCVKACITHLVQSVDLSIKDQVWLTLQNSLFGFCYIPPIDSYFSILYFSSHISVMYHFLLFKKGCVRARVNMVAF